MYLHPEGMLVLWVDIEALLREYEGVEPDAIRREGE
jgi:hypothetical protein